jgi:hypothetical protein
VRSPSFGPTVVEARHLFVAGALKERRCDETRTAKPLSNMGQSSTLPSQSLPERVGNSITRNVGLLVLALALGFCPRRDGQIRDFVTELLQAKAKQRARAMLRAEPLNFIKKGLTKRSQGSRDPGTVSEKTDCEIGFSDTSTPNVAERCDAHLPLYETVPSCLGSNTRAALVL